MSTISKNILRLEDIAFLKLLATSGDCEYSDNVKITEQIRSAELPWPEQIKKRLIYGREAMMGMFWHVQDRKSIHTLSIHMKQTLSLLLCQERNRYLKNPESLQFYKAEIVHFLPYIKIEGMVGASSHILEMKDKFLLNAIINQIEDYVMVNNLMIMACFYNRADLIHLLVEKGADDFFTCQKVLAIRPEVETEKAIDFYASRKYQNPSKFHGSFKHIVYEYKIVCESSSPAYKQFLAKKFLRKTLIEEYPFDDPERFFLLMNGSGTHMQTWYNESIFRCLLCLNVQVVEAEMQHVIANY